MPEPYDTQQMTAESIEISILALNLEPLTGGRQMRDVENRTQSALGEATDSLTLPKNDGPHKCREHFGEMMATNF